MEEVYSNRDESCCPMCRRFGAIHFHSDKNRHYLRCECCGLVFVPTRFHLSPLEERAIYDHHQNCPFDDDYRSFLARLAGARLEQIAFGSTGLDFGSGPGPTLSLMLAEHGHKVDLYDPFYAPDTNYLSATYDFITSTEVVEHLARPGVELEQLWSLIRPSGWLALMTKRLTSREAFPMWHYKNDPTHISFFSEKTFEILAEKWHTKAEFFGADVVLFKKPN